MATSQLERRNARKRKKDKQQRQRALGNSQFQNPGLRRPGERGGFLDGPPPEALVFNRGSLPSTTQNGANDTAVPRTSEVPCGAPVGGSQRTSRTMPAAEKGLASMAVNLRPHCLANVQAKPLDWVWEKVVPVGMMTLLQGEPGCGKSGLAMQVAAAVSAGRSGPRGTVSEGARVSPGHVIVVSDHDHLTHVIRPRLVAAGANLSFVHAWTCSPGNAGIGPDGEKPWELLEHTLGKLERELTRLKDAGTPARLIVLDSNGPLLPIDDRGKVARRLVWQLNRLAADFDAAVMVVTTAGSMTRSRTRCGTVDYELSLAARSVWLVGRAPDSADQNWLLPVKTNLCAPPDGMAWSRVKNDLAWQTVSTTVEQYYELKKLGQGGTEMSRAASWLRTTLQTGPRPVQTVLNEANEQQLSERTLRRAFHALGCHSRMNDSDGTWSWSLEANSMGPKRSRPVVEELNMEKPL